MLPTLQPLWTWLAAALPDAKQRRHMAARQKVADVSRQLMSNYLEAKKDGKDSGSNGNATGSQGAAGGGGGGGFGAVAGGCGISGSSFLASMLDDVAAAAATANGNGNGNGNGRASGDGGGGDGAQHMNEIQVR